nr:hypothetical protein CFP56_34254 [Quercus suber]
MLIAGDFLSLRHIRDQLPQELVNAYDKFQEQVDKYLSLVQAKALEKEEKRVEEEEEWKYAKSTVEDMTRLCMKVDAAIELVRKAVKMAGFTNNMGCPRPIKLLIALEDTDIIKWLASDELSCSCIGYFCDIMDTVYYRVRLLQNRLNVNPSFEDKCGLNVACSAAVFYIIGIGSGGCY